MTLALPVQARVLRALGNATLKHDFLLDSDELDDDPGTNRHTAETSFDADIWIISGTTTHSGTYRVKYRLVDESDVAIDLKNGDPGDSTLAYSDSQSVALDSTQEPPLVREILVFETFPDPLLTLDQKIEYHVQGTLQQLISKGPDVWEDVQLFNQIVKDETDPTQFLHFTNSSSGDPEYNVRAGVSNLEWTRTFSVDTIEEVDHFSATADVFVSRWDGFDAPFSSQKVAFTADFDLIEKGTGASVPLENDGIQGFAVVKANHSLTQPYQPLARSVTTLNAEIRPTVQLSSAEKSYTLKCEISHVESGLRAVYDDGTYELDSEKLLDFNGNLKFGSFVTTFNALGNEPEVLSGSSSVFLNTQIQVPVDEGAIPNRPEYAFGDNTLQDVRLLNNGDALFQSGFQRVYEPGVAESVIGCEYDGVPVIYENVNLTPAGARGVNLVVEFPQGLTLIEDESRNPFLGESLLKTSGTTILDSHLCPVARPVFPLGANARIADESHPMTFAVSSATVDNRALVFTSSSAQYIHDQALRDLENNGSLSDFQKERRSNDLYLKEAELLQGQIRVDFSNDDTSRISTAVEAQQSEFETHFPVGAKIGFGRDSRIEINEGVIERGQILDEVAELSLEYYQTCPGDLCTEGIDPIEIVQRPNDNELNLVPGGGLHAPGSLPSEDSLGWGLRAPEQVAHQTQKFQEASFYMPGYQLYAEDNVFVPGSGAGIGAGDLGPSSLLLAGFNRDLNDPDLHFPTEAEYISGDGDLPGLNFEVTSSGFKGASRLGGNEENYGYDLLPRGAKYYIRLGGVSGRQVATDGTFDSELSLHGFPCNISQFQLSFLDSDNSVPGTTSWVDGSIRTRGPYSNWGQNFTGMRFDCLGEPGEMTPDRSTSNNKALTYWNSTFDLKSIRFVKSEMDPGSCPKMYDAKLAVGAKTRVAYINKDLYGVLAFSPDGNLSTEDDKIGEFNSQLGIPANIPLDGPNKDYNLTTSSKLRFNNPTVQDAPETGFVTFAATIDIPYFTDLQVQAITSANPGNLANFYLAPGWNEGPETFFNSAKFDSSHRGFPPSGISFAEYQEPGINTPDEFLITAKQKLFNLVDLSYPLKWDVAARRFSSMKLQKQELLIAPVEHQIEWMDARFANISFGAEYDGIPQLKLSNYLNNQIDQAADVIASEFDSFAKQSVDQALSEMDRMLEDSLESVIDPLVDAVAAGPLQELHMQFQTIRQGQANYQGFRAEVQKTLTVTASIEYRNRVLTPIITELKKAGATAGEVQSFITQIDQALQDVVKGIDSLVQGVQVIGGEVQYLPELPTDIQIAFDPNFSSGLLFKNGDQRNIVANVIDALLRQYLEPELQFVVSALLNDTTSALNEELAKLIGDINPTLDQIRLALLEVRKGVVAVQQEVGRAEGVAAQISQVILEAENNDILQNIVADLGQRAWVRFLQLEAALGIDAASAAINQADVLISALVQEEFIELLKSELKAGILGSDIVQQLQFLLRQTLYDVQNRVTSAFQSVLNQFSDILKDVVGEAVGKLEEEINPLIGKVSEYMGSGEITGYVEVNGDSLRKLRLDAEMQFEIPEEMSLNVYLEILAYSSEDNFVGSGCIAPGDKAVEVKIGALDVGIDWISEIRANLEVKMTLKEEAGDGRDFPVPNGVGGSFEMTEGVLEFQSFKVIEFGATIAVGFDETYIGAKARAIFSDYEVAAAIFFGRTCTLEPLLFVDPDIGDVVTAGTTFTGAYVYGEVWLPISELVLGIPASCLFRIDAGVGAGAFYFFEGPTYGGKIFLGVSGEALCLVSIRGDVKMIMASQAGNVRGSGTGKFTAKVGWCPFCIKFRKSVKIKYDNGGWGID